MYNLYSSNGLEYIVPCTGTKFLLIKIHKLLKIYLNIPVTSYINSEMNPSYFKED